MQWWVLKVVSRSNTLYPTAMLGKGLVPAFLFQWNVININSPITHYPFTLLYHYLTSQFWRVVACPEEVQLTTFSCLIFIPQWLVGKLAAAAFSPTLSSCYPASCQSPLSITPPLVTVTLAGTITSGDNYYPTLLL